jgi:hypothetical protein
VEQWNLVLNQTRQAQRPRLVLKQLVQAEERDLVREQAGRPRPAPRAALEAVPLGLLLKWPPSVGELRLLENWELETGALPVVPAQMTMREQKARRRSKRERRMPMTLRQSAEAR